MSPNGLPIVCITRGTKWGNPYVLDLQIARGLDPDAVAAMRRTVVENFRKNLLGLLPAPRHVLPFTVDDVRRELRGKNLACWCAPGAPCHADVLLEIANS